MIDKTKLACIVVAISAVTTGIIGTKMTTRKPALAHHRVPMSPSPAPLAPAIGGTVAILPKTQIDCLASAIWYEAGNQPREGKIAVAEVVMTRTRMPTMAKQPCDILRQKNQFSFVHHGIVPAVPAQVEDDVRSIARGVVAGVLRSRVRGAVFFHALYVKPNWRYHLRGTIGEHSFYDTTTTVSG